MQRFQFVRHAVEQPAAIGIHTVVRPHGSHFADKQIISLLIVRLGQQAADKVGAATLHQRHIEACLIKQFHAAVSQLGRIIFAALAAHCQHGFGLCSQRHLQRKPAALLQ